MVARRDGARDDSPPLLDRVGAARYGSAVPLVVSGENGGKINTSMKEPMIINGKAAVKPSRIAITYFCCPRRPASGVIDCSITAIMD